MPETVETHVLVTSGRRCCICFGLRRDASIKRGQIAHLDRDPSNNAAENLAFLCLDHHDEYDARTSQSKGFTIHEVKHYRSELCEFMRTAIRPPAEPASESPWRNLWPPGEWTLRHDEALEFYTGTHRSRSVVQSLVGGTKTLVEVNAEIPPHDLAWTRVIIEDLIQRGWVQGDSGQPSRYDLSQHGRQMLRTLGEIPESVKAAAWRRIWVPHETTSA